MSKHPMNDDVYQNILTKQIRKATWLDFMDWTPQQNNSLNFRFLYKKILNFKAIHFVNIKVTITSQTMRSLNIGMQKCN